MDTVLLIALGVASYLLMFFAQGLILWGSARLFRIGAVSFRRALAAWLVVTAVELPVSGLLLYLAEKAQVLPPWQLLASSILALCVQLGVVWWTVKRFLHAPRWRAAAAGITTLVVGSLFSFLLAVIMKSAFFEAFKIPTGSMATAILGRHADVSCANCGCAYPVSLTSRPEPWEGRMPIPVACPNCGQTAELPIDTRPRSGDRILVRKHASPQRWELAVFRIPDNPSIQYVARVVGLPGEEVELFGGDVFVNGRRMPKAPAEAGDLWLFAHDTGCVARQPLPNGPRWKPAETASKWKEAAGEWTFSGNDSESQKLSFTGEVTSELAYNGEPSGLRSGERRLLVGDLMVECPLAQFSGEGTLGFQWEFQGQQVTATVSATGRVELVASDRNNEQAAEDGKTAHARGDLSRPLSAGPRLAFAVRDGQAYLLEDDRPVVQLAVGPQDLASAKTRSKQQASPCRIAIIASRCSLSIPRLRLFKDVYYCRAEEMEGPLPEFADRAQLDAASYWMLGDNSSHSRDARFFGAVRKEAITGVPRWIYWPHARWHAF